jgi:hypothetical protein
MLDDDDDEVTVLMTGTYMYATHLEKYCNRGPCRVPPLSGLEWVQRKLANANSCYNMFRMTPDMFFRLHSLLTDRYGLKSNPKTTSIEALGMFLWMVGAAQSVRQAEDRFERSLATVHNLFHRVLKCVIKLGDDIIAPRDPLFRTMHDRLQNRRFFPFFNGCIGAIDGTHVPMVVPSDKFIQHLCRKGKTTQNVLAACDFDMVFTFVLAGWPGSVHDMRVFDDALTTYKDVFPHPPTGIQLVHSSIFLSN